MTAILGAESTADDVLHGHDLTGRRAIITGAASGIGVETARALARAGADVTLAVRDVAAGTRTADDIRTAHPHARLQVRHLDLADIASVDRFTTEWSDPLHTLINNAGIMNAPLSRTAPGWESHFAVNHLGHFALATGLHDALARADGARVVSVSSSGHGSSDIHFDDPHHRRRRYDSGEAYGQSKTANVLFAVAAGQRWEDDSILVKAVMPGGIWTNLQRHWDPTQLATMRAAYPGKTPQQGAATSVYVSTHPSITASGPVYYEDCHPAALTQRITDGLHGVLPYALDDASADTLWALSTDLVNQARRP
jgi:NAD(P)-dependent dehydrogenase (short-subunit alcohol dehydrogenase family)